MKLEEALLRLGDEFKIAMAQTLTDNKSRGSGALAASIDYKVEERDSELLLIRTMLKYGDYVDQGIGRGPGKPPPAKDIMEWLKMKKIPIPAGLTVESFAFAIANKIGKQGTDPKPKPFIAPSINRVLETKGQELLSKAGIDEIEANINNKLKNITITG